jgi:hypothetical protein
MGINQIEIKNNEESIDSISNINEVLIKNAFDSPNKINKSTFRYKSKENEGRILLTDAPDYYFNSNGSIFLGFYFVNKELINHIKQSLKEKGYSFEHD